MPEISVIIPVYNAEQHLPQCLDSLVCQTFHNIEIICVDDLSTDRSLEIARSYAAADSRIQVHCLGANSRQGAARNLGLQVAHAPYIGFVDSDDYVAPDYFENLHKAIVLHNVDIVITPYQLVDTEGIEIRKNEKSTLFERTLGLDWKDNCVVSDTMQKLKCIRQFMVMNKLYRKMLIETVRFPEKTRFEDVPFTMEAVCRAGSVCTIPDGGYFYRRHAASTTSETDVVRFNELVAMLKMTNAYISQASMPLPEKQFCRQVVVDNLHYTIRALARSKSNLSLQKVKQIRAILPPASFVYLLWRLFRKHMKTMVLVIIVITAACWGYMWLTR
jgi:glycosyltransferase involved in cell wall biosynthesis